MPSFRRPPILDEPSQPPNPFLTHLPLSDTNPPSPSTISSLAASLVHTIARSLHLATDLGQIYSAIFTHVAKSTSAHKPALALLSAIQTQEPTRPRNSVSCAGFVDRSDSKLQWKNLPGFSMNWHDLYTSLLVGRGWPEGAKYLITFVDFSAMFLQHAKERVGISSI